MKTQPYFSLTYCMRGHSEITQQDLSRCGKKGLLGIKLSRLSPSGQTEEEMVGKQAEFIGQSAGVVLEPTEAIKTDQELEPLPKVIDLWGGLRKVPGRQKPWGGGLLWT